MSEQEQNIFLFAVASESIRKHAAALDDPELDAALALSYDSECFEDDTPEPIEDIMSSYAIVSPSPPSNEDHYIDLLLASYDEDVELEMENVWAKSGTWSTEKRYALFLLTDVELYAELYKLAEQKLARRLGRFATAMMVFSEKKRLEGRVKAVEIAFKNFQQAAFSYMP